MVHRIKLIVVAWQLIYLGGCSPQPTKLAPSNSWVKEESTAFPGAEGFGKNTTGGRGGDIFIVTNLSDNGPGSLREGIRKNGPRIIVFATSGTISLESALDINNGDLTIAGQSAPGDGICLKNFPVSIKAGNVIIRYMRFRMGDEKAVQGDAFGANKGVNNIIIDHCSMSWATDESASFYRNKNFTLQWSIISESLNQSVHAKGDHGYGGIWGGEGATFHHNLLASHNSRTPLFSGSATTPNSKAELVDFRNNVIYNWGENNIYGGERGRYNLVNNYFKAGPATHKSKANRIVEPYSPYGNFYVTGNVVEGDMAISQNNWAGGVQTGHPDSAKVTSAFPTVPLRQQDARQAYEQVLQSAGASHKRDYVDTRVGSEVRAGKSTSGKKQNGLIDSQKEVGGWPELKTFGAPIDSDKDGIPDSWEKQNGLNPQDPSDAKALKLHQVYSNIEVYLNSLVATI